MFDYIFIVIFVCFFGCDLKIIDCDVLKICFFFFFFFFGHRTREECDGVGERILQHGEIKEQRDRSEHLQSSCYVSSSFERILQHGEIKEQRDRSEHLQSSCYVSSSFNGEFLFIMGIISSKFITFIDSEQYSIVGQNVW
jgi:hypothetical protein